MIETVFLHSARPAELNRAADRLGIPPDGRVLLACRRVTDAEHQALSGWYIIELPVTTDRWGPRIGRSFWKQVGHPRRVVAPWPGVGFPGLGYRNVLRFLAVQRGMEALVIDREGRTYPITWGSFYWRGTIRKALFRNLAELMLGSLLSRMAAVDRAADRDSRVGS